MSKKFRLSKTLAPPLRLSISDGKNYLGLDNNHKKYIMKIRYLKMYLDLKSYDYRL